MNINTEPTNNKIEKLEKKIDGKIDYISCDLTKQIEQVEEKIFVNREKIAEMDKKIWQIQKSTKTLFKIFERPHNWLRSKSKTYYNWHLNPYANSTHWIAAIVALFLAVFLSSWQLGFFGGSKPASMAAAGIPKMINYQGKLTDLNNIPKPDGTYSMKFSIYDSPTGGNRLWTCAGTLEAPTAVSISVQYGIFSAMLGSGGDCTNALGLDFNSDAYYLGVTVGSDSEMADRKRIGAVGYAYNSDTVDGKNESDFALLAGRAGGQTIIGGTAANDVMVLQGNSASGNTSTNASIQYKVGDSGGTTAMTILNNGNIGIGTTAPSTLLQLGTSGTKAGTLSLAGVISGLVTLQTTAEAGTWAFTLPTSAGTADYVLKTDGNGVTSWVAQTGGAGYWTDGGNYLYPTAYESIRVYDSGGTDYIDIAHDSTDAIISFANTTALNINIGVIDLSAQTVDVTLDNTVDALNFDSNTLSIDASNNRIGVGTASPTQTLEVTGTGKFSSDNINSFQVSKADGTYVMNVDTTNSYVGIGDGTNVNYFDNTGSDQSFIVPAGVTSITVKLWGAGGGGGANSSPGGGGGYATATLDVTPGETLTIMVGTGGQYRSGGAGQGPTVYGGGGNTGTAGYGGQGGGRSAIKRSSTELITAGGGGGAGWDISGDWGGGGGGSVGQDANNGSNGGKGGTQSAGGAGGGSAEAGSAYQGGTCNDGDGGGGGGGGGGYYGGGAGTGSSNGGGGGGGSAYVPAGGSTLSGSGATPGNNSDSDRGTAGTGGPVGVNGYSGRVVISYAGGLAKNTLDVFGSIAAGSYAGVNTSPDNGLVISGNVGIGTYSPSTLLQLGTAGTTAGVLSMAGGTSGLVTLQTAAVAGTWTMTLPTSAGTADYVLKTDGNGVTSWVAQTGGAGYWTDGGNYLYPTAYESIRVYDSGGTDYIDIAQNGTDALMTFANTSLLNIDSNTLVVDVANDRVGMGTASPAAVLDITTSNTAYDTTARVARITNSSASGQSPFDYYINGTLRGRTRVDYGGNFTIMANGGYFSFLSGGDYGVGTEVMRILANGNVGIGTTSPSTLFQVGNTGSIKGVLSLAGNTSGLVTIQPAAAAGTWTFTLPTSAGTADYVLKTDGNGVTSWAAQTGGVSYWTLSGNSLYPNSTSYAVGIGTTSPDRELEVGSASVSGDTTIWAGTTSWGEGLRLIAKDSNSYGAYFIGSATDDANGIEWGFGRLNIASGDGARNDFNYSNKDWSGSGLNVGNSSTQLWLDKSTGYSAFGSRLGVNTSSPQAYLHVKGTVSYGSARISPTSDNGEAALAFFQDAAGTDTNDSWVIGQGGWGNTSDLVFGNENNGAGGDVRMLIEKGGNIGVSTSSPSARLDVHGAGTGTGIALQTADSNGNAKFSILDNGQMGLGTTSTNEVITANGRLSLQETESPSSTSGYGKIYPKSSDSNLYYMNASGTEYKLNVTSDFYWSRNSGSGYVYLTTGTDSVGIGTSAPDRKLEVVTDINTPQVRFSYGDDHYIELMATNGYSSFSSTDRTIRLTSGSTTTPKYTDISTNTDGYLYINPQGGYTGLGTSVPNRRLEVNTDVNTPQARFSYTSDHYIELMATNGYSLFSSTDRTIRLTSGSTSTPKYTDISTNTDGYLYINPEGLRTGLGISTPSRTLEVAVNFNTAEEGTPPLRVTNNTGSGYKWIEFYPFNGGTNITSNGAEPIGIQNTNPRRAVDVYNSDNPQFRITQTIDTNYVDFQATSSGYLYINSSGSRVGIGDSTPDAFFSVGASSQFQVDSSGNIIKIRNVTYSWPSSQGSANTYLKNDGSGNLSWASDMVGSSYVGECTASTTTPEGSAECTITDAKYLMISGFDSGADAQHTCAVHFQGNVGGTAHGYAWLGAGGTISSCTFIGFK